MEPVLINDLEQINLDTNAVIEASAGTGKTYTIEFIVLALLKSGKIKNIDEILIVTFTEKATGELRQRIYEKLSNSLKEENNIYIRESLENYDSASIHTIHGFCNKVLQNHAFENRQQFDLELIDDTELYQSFLYTIMREEWPNLYGEGLEKILRLSEYPKIDIMNQNSKWENRVIQLAQKIRGENDKILPEIDPVFINNISDIESKIKTYCSRIENLIGEININNIPESYFYKQYEKLNFNIKSINKRLRDIVTPVLEFIAFFREETADIAHFSLFINNIKLKNCFHELIDGWKKAGENYQEHLPELMEIVDSLEKLRSLDLTSFFHQLEISTIYRLKELVQNHKFNEGLISYDDMILQVNNALKDKNGILTTELQNKYRYAIVDEFQDTDMIQWNIFKSIFLEGKDTKLFIIGDPKQAIYGFRGADIFAYYTAKKEMITNYNASYYTLHYNYRSVPNLISTFNNLFKDKNWFKDDEIIYTDKHFPDNNEHINKLSLYLKNTDNAVVVDLGQCSGTEARKRMAEFIGNEISELLSTQQSLIQPNDIAILIRKWNEADPIEESLQVRNINYSYYKKSGLFQSEEALSMLFLLRAIADLSDEINFRKSLITNFFRVPIEEIKSYNSLAGNHPISVLFKRWNIYGANKNWSLLFQSIIEESDLLSQFNPPDSNVMSIYTQIIEHLETEAFRKRYDIFGMINYLSQLHYRGDGNEDINIQKINPDKNAVQLMTIHSSKGLQFKIVFIAGGFTKGNRPDYLIYHKNGKRIYDLRKNSDSIEYFEKEQNEEEKRLLYVAITRSIFKVYLPSFSAPPRSKPGIIGNELQEVLTLPDLKKNITKKIFKDNQNIYSLPVENEVNLSNYNKKIHFPDDKLKFLFRKFTIDSFSNLKDNLVHQGKKGISITHDFSYNGKDLEYDDDSITLSGKNEKSLLEDNELPHGITTGLLLHEILEEIDFYSFNKQESRNQFMKNNKNEIELIDRKIIKYYPNLNDLEFQQYRNESINIIWNTLTTELAAIQSPLSAITNKFHEVEFYFPVLPDISKKNIKKNSAPDFIHGFIDLIFENKNRYYIADWKSNYLEDGYKTAAITKNIFSSSYDLQYKIYTIASLKWLKQQIPDFSYENNFGGILYFYLRGMDPVNSNNGVFFYKPEDINEIEEYEKHLQIINASIR